MLVGARQQRLLRCLSTDAKTQPGLHQGGPVAVDIDQNVWFQAAYDPKGGVFVLTAWPFAWPLLWPLLCPLLWPFVVPLPFRP